MVTISYTKHARERMKERDISEKDVENIFNTGGECIDYDDIYGRYVYECGDYKYVYKINENNDKILITVMNKENYISKEEEEEQKLKNTINENRLKRKKLKKNSKKSRNINKDFKVY